MGLTYKRWLADDFMKLLAGEYSFLVQDCCKRAGGDAYGLDVQLRPKNTLTFYCGATSVMSVVYDGQAQPLKFEARSYQDHAGCRKEFAALQDARLTQAPARIQRACRAYLEAVVENAVRSRYKCQDDEGYWEQRFARLFGCAFWRPWMEWLVVDRQAIVSYTRDRGSACQEKSSFLSPIQLSYRGKAEALHARHQHEPRSKRWATAKGIGNELDLLAIGPGKELVCIEAKLASNATAYYAPLQAALYGELFDGARGAVSNDLKILVRQKVALGLLPKEAEGRLPEGDFTGVRSVLLIVQGARFPMQSAMWPRLSETMETIDPQWRPSVIVMP